MSLGAVLKALLLAGLCMAGVARAELLVTGTFSENMVLQRHKPIVVWGYAEAGEEVQVTLDGQQASGRADELGYWRVQMPPREAGGPYVLGIAGATEKREITNVMVGEVWICSGQSNMQFPMKEFDDTAAAIAGSENSQIRCFVAGYQTKLLPQRTVGNGRKWWVARPGEDAKSGVGNWPATPYFFARELHRALQVPVGVIHVAWGGTPIESFMSPAALQEVPECADALAAYERKANVVKAAIRERRDQQDGVALVMSKAIERDLPVGPVAGVEDRPNMEFPGAFYHGLIRPIAPYGARGFLWYQGESNVKKAPAYAQEMAALTRQWRKLWDDEQMPFFYVQLAGANYSKDRKQKGSQDLLPAFWDMQRRALKLIPDSGMVTLTDLDNKDTIHPHKKDVVGARLARLALARTYRVEGVVPCGPLVKEIRQDGRGLRVVFDLFGSTLQTRDGRAPDSFEIAGEDGKYHMASAAIHGDSVVVSALEVPAPVAVRFGWDELADPNLCNADRLPASPFVERLSQ